MGGRIILVSMFVVVTLIAACQAAAQLRTPIVPAPRMPDGLYAWTDGTLSALGTYSYAVAADLDDGRVGNSSPVTFTSQIFEATNVRGLKASAYSAVVEFKDAAVPASIYRLYGTGLPLP